MSRRVNEAGEIDFDDGLHDDSSPDLDEVRGAAWAIVKNSRQLNQHQAVVRWARAYLGLSNDPGPLKASAAPTETAE
jgi:hypothetical protein